MRRDVHHLQLHAGFRGHQLLQPRAPERNTLEGREDASLRGPTSSTCTCSTWPPASGPTRADFAPGLPISEDGDGTTPCAPNLSKLLFPFDGTLWNLTLKNLHERIVAVDKNKQMKRFGLGAGDTIYQCSHAQNQIFGLTKLLKLTKVANERSLKMNLLAISLAYKGL